MSDFDRLGPGTTGSKKETPFAHRQEPLPTPTPSVAPPPIHPAQSPSILPGTLPLQDGKRLTPLIPSMSKLFGSMFGDEHPKAPDLTTPAQQEQIDDAVKTATKQLDTGFLNPVTDGEARTALKTLSGLPKEIQGKAVEKLDPDSFGRLLEEVPAAEREQFKPLMAATTDPERKLRLFAEYHKSKARSDAAKDHEKTQDEGGFFSQNAEQKKNEQTNKQRDSIGTHTEEEIDGELSFLLKKSKEGKLPADAVQKYIDAKEKEHDTERASNINQYSTLEGLPDEDRAEFVKQSVEKKLASGFMNPVTDGEATDALKNIQSLPQNLQGKVLEGMDKDAFNALLDNVPDKKPEDFKALYESTHDPERKLLLWAEYHKSQATSDAKRLEEKGGDGDTTRRNKLRGTAASETQSEVDDEVTQLQQKIKEGKASEKDILELDQRKQLEHEIEMNYNINLTSDRGSGGALFGLIRKRERRVWQLDELKLLQGSFGRLPKDMISNNHALEEIHREADDNGDTGTGGYHSGKMIKMFDSGSGTKSQPNSIGWRFDGETSKLGGHPRGQEVTPFEAVLVHEIGHAVHDEKGPAGNLLDKYKQNAGWNSYSKGELKDAMRAGLLAEGKKPDEIDAIIDANLTNLQDNRKKNYSSRPSITVNGKVYEVDPYSGKFLSYNEGAIPGGQRWGYARSNPLDNFAEHYSMAVHNPEQLQTDLVTKPKQDFETRQAEYQVKKDLLTKLENDSKSDKKELEALRSDVASAHKEMEHAQNNMTTMEKQWSLMRNEVLHTDTQVQNDAGEIQNAVNKLPADKQGAAKTLQDQFEADAKGCATPEQVMRLRQQLEAKLAKL